MTNKFRSGRLMLQVWMLIGMLMISLYPINSMAAAQEPDGTFWKVRSIYTAEYGIKNPGGFAFSPEANAFILSNVSQAVDTELVLVTMGEDPAGTVTVGSAIEAPWNMAFNGHVQSLFALNGGGDQLIEIKADNQGRPNRLENAVSQVSTVSLELGDARGISFDPATGQLFILDAANSEIISVAPRSSVGFGSMATAGTVSLSSLGQVSLQGVAFNPANAHLYVSNPDDQKVYELTASGDLVSTLDLASLELANPQALLFAPSADSTDDPARMNLFVLDGGGSTQGGAIVELSLVTPAALPPGTTLLPSSLVRTIDASNSSWNPSAPDTAGVSYWPLHDQLLIVDSEVEEMPPYWQGFNVFRSNLAGSLVGNCTTFTAAPVNGSYNNFTNEPTGVAVNPNNNHIFITQDNQGGKVFEIAFGADNTYCTSDDTVTTLELSTVFGADVDSEDVSYGANKLYIAGGVNAEVYTYDLGANGVIGGDDGAATHWDTALLGFNDLEGIAYNTDTGTVFIASTMGGERYLGELTTSGTLIRGYDLNYLGSVVRSGLGFAPTNGNPSVKNLYMVSRGVDNNGDPNENDGLVWEISLSAAPTNTAPTVSTPIADVNVLEDAANSTIDLWPSFADAQSTDAQLTYTVTTNTNAALFTSAAISGNQNLVLDYAPNANGTADITVRATDPGALFVEDTFTVTVTAVNDAPSFTPGGNQAVPEDSGPQTVAGWASAMNDGDPEVTQTLSFTVTNNSNGLFSAQPAVNAANGNLTYTTAPNMSGVATVNVTLSDNGGTANGGINSFGPQQFTITISGENDPPTNISLAPSSVDENKPAGTAVGTFSTTDDSPPPFAYAFCGGVDDSSFQISGATLKTGTAFNYEAKNSYSICVRSTDSAGKFYSKTLTVTVNNVFDQATFADVPTSYWAWKYIESIYAAGITGGCGGNNYCPTSPVTRAQMAVFLLKGIHGGSYTPPAVGASTGFADVPTNYWAAAWIKQLAAEKITGGCGGGNYCPEQAVTRDQMAIFLLKAKHGSAYVPPPPTGLVFADVPLGYWAGAWIEQLAAEGVTGGCGVGIYCPLTPVTRDQMAVFLQKTFNLPLPYSTVVFLRDFHKLGLVEASRQKYA